MADEIQLFKKTLLTWTYNTLHAKYPAYFNSDPYTDVNGTTVVNAPNVFWSDSVGNRPLDATECYLDIESDVSASSGTDGKFYQDTIDNKWYYELREPHDITVTFIVSSMKNESLNLSALQAQNLSINACSYLKTMLKSGSASDYFCYENDILTPILVCSQHRNMSDITDTSIYEDTRNRHTNQFSCMFTFTQIEKREVDLAQKVYGEVIPDDISAQAQTFEVELTED